MSNIGDEFKKIEFHGRTLIIRKVERIGYYTYQGAKTERIPEPCFSGIRGYALCAVNKLKKQKK